MNALLKLENVTHTPIGDGDVGVIFKKDGTFQAFNCHAAFDPKNLTPEQKKQGETLHAILVLLGSPEMMDALKEIAAKSTAPILEKGSLH